MFRFAFALFCCLISTSTWLSAQSSADISPEKSALIKELLDITSAKKNAVTSFNALLDQNERSMPEIIWQAITGSGQLNNLSAHEQEEIRKIAGASSQRVAQRMRQMLLERVDFGEVIDQVYYPLFDKYFTSEELSALNSFYKTPAGKKSISLFPSIYGEAVAKMSDIIAPKVNAIMVEIMKTEQPAIDKEVARLVQERKSASPVRAKHPTGTSRPKH